jgi:CheY-like chemotaxis protein
MEINIEVRFDKNPILILEDDPLEVRILKETFNELQLHNEIIIAKNGVEGLEYLDNRGNKLPGLILTDINMPKMNGIEFLKVVKGHRIYKYIPVVVLTSSKFEKDRQEAFALSAAGYMTKPLNHNEYIKMIGTLVNYWTISEWYHIPGEY